MEDGQEEHRYATGAARRMKQATPSPAQYASEVKHKENGLATITPHT
jgi:hypothetical protein